VLREPQILELLQRRMGCVSYNYPKYTQIAFQSGLNYMPFGIKIKNATPFILGLRTEIISSFEWRFNRNTDDEYFNVRLQKDALLKIRNSSISLLGELKKFTKNTYIINEMNLISSFVLKNVRFLIGYSHQDFKNNEVSKTNSNGIYLGVHRTFYDYTRFEVNSKYLNNEFQFDINATQRLLRNKKLGIGIRYERIRKFDEITASLSYTFSY
jgi:hypothetical protein